MLTETLKTPPEYPLGTRKPHPGLQLRNRPGIWPLLSINWYFLVVGLPFKDLPLSPAHINWYF